jgi:hypothetical protein
LAIGFALRQFRPRKLAGFGELVALVFAIAVAVGNFSGSLGIIGEGNTGVQGDGRSCFDLSEQIKNTLAST